MDFLQGLNKDQHRAATATDGPVLIVAGPGTGKTKTLTARIAHLFVSGRARPEQILALTFTKKAAEEMRSRVASILGGAKLPRIATFHALCHELLGGTMRFIGEQERLAIIRSLPRPTALKSLSVREAGLLISKTKNGTPEKDAVQNITQAYNSALHEKGLNDFDDLLLKAHELLSSDDKLQTTIRARYKHILVDEFQDTNRLQYKLLNLLRGNDSIFVIGDPNQSIYGFRGASGGIFEQFKADFPNVQRITLHVNYRSAPQIVQISNAIFNEAPLQAHTTSYGEVRAVQVLNEYSEANWVLVQIQHAIGGGDFLQAISDDDRAKHRTLKDFAILYRSRSCAMAMQKAIAESGLPYQIVGEGSPYDQPSVQDAITLLKALHTGEDVVLKNATKSQCRILLEQIDKSQPPSRLVETIIAKFGLEPSQGLLQLSNTLVRFDDLPAAVKYLDDISEQQFYDPNADAITLLTIHAAKGLEFAHVFLIGAEEDILPHSKADIEEERRLFYVAVTRARERLDIVHAKNRSGKFATPSQFIQELPTGVLPKTTDVNLATDQRRAQNRKLKRSQQRLF